ncbi:hypothetical protein ACIO3O_39365 [Streptomyces sp. NPDC087440]|uniref:hypothetical protein n=1 Tax=Streptomyces sp. NPDC087440 TaxID=3365790 RepID=UPI003806FAFA
MSPPESATSRAPRPAGPTAPLFTFRDPTRTTEGVRIPPAAEVLEQNNTPRLYGDPAAWAVVQGIRRTLPGWFERDVADAPLTETGVLVCSATTTRPTRRAVAAQGGQGRIRPRHFAASGPGLLAGLPCIVLGFRGPTLTLTAPYADIAADADALARTWLTRVNCRAVLLVEHAQPADHLHTVRCHLLTPDENAFAGAVGAVGAADSAATARAD